MKSSRTKILLCEFCKTPYEKPIYASRFLCDSCKKEGRKLYWIKDPKKRKEISKKGALKKQEKYLKEREERIENEKWENLVFSEKRERILREQRKRCAICNIEQIWNGKPLKFEIDHINGNRKDNSRENLRLVCPNCHSQTSTYKTKNNPLSGKTRYKEEDILKALEKSNSIYEAIQKLGMNPHGGNYKRIRKIIKKYNLESKFIF